MRAHIFIKMNCSKWVALVTFCLGLTPFSTHADSNWKPLPSGLFNLQRVIPKTKDSRRIAFQAVRVDVNQFEFKTLRPKNGKVSSVATMAKEYNALVGINGSFFLEDMSPMGLLISEGVESNGIRKVDWGVFYVSKGGESANLIHTRQWKKGKKVEFAIQTGPRLVVDGKPLTFRDSMARRSILCIQNDQTVVMLATENAVLMRDLAVFLSRSKGEGGLGCEQALNLDGGSSTHLVIDEKGASSGVTGFDHVPVGIGVFKR